jgi:hypothetical protein
MVILLSDGLSSEIPSALRGKFRPRFPRSKEGEAAGSRARGSTRASVSVAPARHQTGPCEERRSRDEAEGEEKELATERNKIAGRSPRLEGAAKGEREKPV